MNAGRERNAGRLQPPLGVNPDLEVGSLVERDALADREVLARELHRAEWVADGFGAGASEQRCWEIDDPVEHEIYAVQADAVLSSSWLTEHDAARDAEIAELRSERSDYQQKWHQANRRITELVAEDAENCVAAVRDLYRVRAVQGGEPWSTAGGPVDAHPSIIDRHPCGCVTGWDDVHEGVVLIRCAEHGPVGQGGEPQ